MNGNSYQNNNNNNLYDDSESSNQYNSNMHLAKSSQMTPPKSVESTTQPPSISQILTPFSNPHSVPPNSQSTITANAASCATAPGSAVASTSASGAMPPASYDDLNNIFEEESSDEQNQQQQQIQQPTPVNHHQQQQQQQQQFQPNFHPNNSTNLALSVVMTPPSHENKVDDLLLFNSHLSLHLSGPNSVNNNINTLNQDTKNLVLSDYNSLIDEKPAILLNSLTDIDPFSVPKINPNSISNKFKVETGVDLVFSSNTHQKKSLNKYKWSLSQNKSQDSNKKSPPKLKHEPIDIIMKTKTQQQQPKTPSKPILVHKPHKNILKIKPMDRFVSHLDNSKLEKTNLNLDPHCIVNAVCLSINLSDSMLNTYRDVNFDSCTLCVCSNNGNIKGIDFSILISNDILNENSLLPHLLNSQTSCSNNNNNNDVSNQCTCGFSSLVNRSIMNRTAHCIRLSDFLKYLAQKYPTESERDQLLPNYSMINLLNSLTHKELKDRQLIILNSNNCNGLFVEDYVEILGIVIPHQLISNLLQQTQKLSSNLVTRKFFNGILLRENYLVKKALSNNASKYIDNNLLDVFDLNYSNPFITVYDAYDIFYDYESENYECKQGTRTLIEYDENNVCSNMIGNLLHNKKQINFNTESSFLFDKWLYKSKTIKSNLEVTKSLKLLQPILEETVQKKYTTSRMWESFQGPLTWQHFCRLASGGATMSGSSAGSVSSSSMSSSKGSGSSGGVSGGTSGVSSSSSNTQNNQNSQTYEPEPIPALLVSSADKEWLTISPYSVKFWDKLNLEPYSKYKNIAYLIISPEMNQNQDSLMDTADASKDNLVQQSVKEYFKELNSVYELCRLGIHRPALRIAPDSGVVKVPLFISSANSKLRFPGIKVDKWFDQVQLNPQTRYLGKQLKLYAKSLKSLALRIKNGHDSTLGQTLESNFFDLSKLASNNTKNKSSGGSANSQNSSNATTTSFQSSFTPTLASINLDKSIYDESKNQVVNTTNVLKQEPQVTTAQQVSNTPSLSNILSQSLGGDIMSSHPSPLDFSGTHAQPNPNHSQQQAQILNFSDNNTNLNSNNNSTNVNILNELSGAGQNTSSQAQSQQQSLINLNFNLNSPPCLFLYIVDPFEYTLYNSLIKLNDLQTEVDLEEDFNETLETNDNHSQKYDEYDLKRLVKIGLFKAYDEFFTSLPDLFRYSTQFQLVPLNLLLDLEQKTTNMYIKSMQTSSIMNQSNYSSYFASGFGTSWSDLDMDFKYTMLKHQAFNTFSKSRRFFMSPVHNFYMHIMSSGGSSRAKSLTGFGPAANEERFLRQSLLNSLKAYCGTNSTPEELKNAFSKFRKLQFYSPLFILAPSTIASQAVNLLASNLFYKQETNKSSLISNIDCSSIMPNFIQLNMSNSHYGYLNTNLNDIIHNQQTNLNLNQGSSAIYLNSSAAQQQAYQQQCNVLYVSYCLSDDQRYLLTCCTDENGELIESTSIDIQVEERFKRREWHSRRIALRKLWEFIIVVISQTAKPWRLVIGRLGRLGHSELRGWACLLSKNNLQRVCAQLKEQCSNCNTLNQMEMPCILSACLISMETCDTISVYPEAYSREDKLAAAALTGQQQQMSSHAAQSHGVSCTHIITFPVSAIIQTPVQPLSSVMSSMKDDGNKQGNMPMDDFFDLFKFDDCEMNDIILADNNEKPLNESGQAGEGGELGTGIKDKYETLLNQEEVVHLDQQPLAVGYYVSTARCGPLPKWLRGNVPSDTNFHTFKSTLHIHNRYALENDELSMKTENSHKLDSPVTYEVLR